MQEAPSIVWPGQFPDAEWRVYSPVIEAAIEQGIGFAIGGGFAYSFHSGFWRDTKDLDFYIQHADLPAMITILHRFGLTDLYDRMPYDRNWIHRTHRGDHIIDVIWQMANYRAQVDAGWLQNAVRVELRGLPVRILAPEELVFAKLYVMQRERCDWPDLLSVLHSKGPTMDWDRLLALLGEDAGLLRGLLCVFGWLCPTRASQLPDGLWRRLGMTGPPAGPDCERDPQRAKLLDSRPWFSPRVLHETEGG